MANRENTFIEITPEVLLKAYACGIFPMAESADDPALYWIEPDMRGIIPLEGFHVPARLARTVRTTPFTVVGRPRFRRGDRRLRRGQARPRPHLDQRRASARSTAACSSTAIATSVEVYDGDALVGGLYGVSLGRAFFGESMFHRARDASKIALVHLVARLRAGGYRLLDTQYVTDHLKTFGAVEVRQAALSPAAGRGDRRRSRFRRAAARPPGQRRGSARAVALAACAGCCARGCGARCRRRRRGAARRWLGGAG